MPAVIIQTIHPLNREGTRLPLGGRTYHFTPNRRGDYVAEVMDVDVPSVLSISQGYKVYEHQLDVPTKADEITLPPEVREAAARAIPAPPRPRGQDVPFGPRKKAADASE